MKTSYLVFSWLAFNLISMSANAEAVMSCGEASGKAYYFPHALEPNGEWKNDGYSGGVNNLVRLADGNYDIEFGGGKSINNSGGRVIPLGPDGRIFLTSVMSAIELYIFDREKNKLAILQYRTGLADKAATYIADCY